MTNPVTDYTSLDFDSVKQDLQRFNQSRFGINLTNFNPSEPLVVFIESLAYVTDLLAYTQNQHTQEGIPVRARRMANFRDAVKPLDFSPQGPGPSSTVLVVELDPAYIAGHSVTITPSHKVTNTEGVPFQPTGTTVFPLGGATSGSINAIQAETFNEVLAAASPGTASQKYILTQYPVREDSVHVYVDGLEIEAAEQSVAIESPTSLKYDISFDGDWKATITFGDGANGMIPPVGLPITVDYDTCVGSSGTTAKDTITEIVSMPTGVLSVNNPSDSSPGSDPETLENAQARLPGVARANRRAISLADYAAEATTVTGIAKATAIRGMSGTGGCGCPYVIYAAPPGGGALTAYLKSSVITHLRDIGMTGRRVIVKDAPYVQLSIEVDVFVSPQASATDTKTLVTNTILDAYDFSSLDFGSTLPVQSFYDNLDPSAVKGVSRVFARTFTVIPSMGFYEQQTPTGNGSVVYPVALDDVVRREFKITVTNGGGLSGPALFSVTYRTLGVATEVSDDSLIDETALFETNTLPSVWTFRYRPYDTDTGTFPILGNTTTSISLNTTFALQDRIQPTEEFCVEKLSAIQGKCYRDSWTISGGGTAQGTTVTAPGTGWAPGDTVHILSSTGTNVYAEVVSGVSGAWVIDQTIPAFIAGTTMTMTCVWSDSTELQFELIQGSTRWVVGDTFYIDTYSKVGDIDLRDRSYPELLAENLVVRPIGGR